MLRHILLDLTTGVFAWGLFLLVAFYSTSPAGKGMETAFAGAGLLFIVAGFLRGASPPPNAGFKALLLVSVFVAFYIFARLSPGVKLGCLSIIAYGSSLAGIHSRRAWAKGAKRQATFILGVVAVAIEASAVFGAPALARRFTTRRENVPAPAISFVRMDGTSVDSAQFKGRVTVLYFWASWCPPCWQEFPRMEKLYKGYRLSPDVVFLAVAIPGNGETSRTVQGFIEYGGYDIPVALDVHRAAARLHLRVFPTLLIIDRDWHVRLVQAGYDGAEHLAEDLSKEINSLLAK
jgi:thiol-disulfide isomerase/thioredoxin